MVSRNALRGPMTPISSRSKLEALVGPAQGIGHHAARCARPLGFGARNGVGLWGAHSWGLRGGAVQLFRGSHPHTVVNLRKRGTSRPLATPKKESTLAL